ncbi:MAG: ABC transporter ATP-binding protein [archaeon]|nr:ABC transporter ATP-binding protein [archaeon]
MGLGLSALGGWIGFKIKRRQVLPAPRVGVPQPTIRSPEPIPSGIPEAFERKKNFLTDDEVVKVVDVEKVYRRGPTEVYVLNGINMNAKRGEFVVIVGPSGSGKTTLLNIISTLDRPTRGRSYLDGEDTTLMMEDQRAMIRRKKIGFIFQSYNLINVLTALENVELSMFISGLKEDRKKRALGLLNSVGLSDRANHRPDELSGGEQQRVAIARALANKPSLIIADEPTANLDTRNEDEILKILYDLSKSEEVTVILATHNPFISRFADKVIELKKR